MAQYRTLNDEEIADVARGEPLPPDVSLSDFAYDALRMRRALRGDSRRAEQLRNLSRALTVATDKADAAIKGETAAQECEAKTAERIADWLETGGRGGAALAKMVREGRWR